MPSIPGNQIRRRKTRVCQAFAWLEVLLALTILALSLQLFPSVWWNVVAAVDLRNWSRGDWLGLNVAIVLTLVAIRFGTMLIEIHARPRGRAKEDCEKPNTSAG